MPFSMSGNSNWSYNRFDAYEDRYKNLEEGSCGSKGYQKGGEVKCDKCDGKGCDHCEGKGTHKKSGKKGSKPDYLDFDKDGNKEEPMKDALKSKKEENLDEALRGKEYSDAISKLKKKIGHKDPDPKRGPGYTKAISNLKRNLGMKEAYLAVYGIDENLEEGIDFKGARRIDDARAAEQKKKDEKNPSGKDRRLMLRKFRPGASAEERAEGGRDSMREKGTIPKKDGKDMFEALQATGLFTAEEIEALTTESALNPFQVHFDKDGKEYTSKGTKEQRDKITKNREEMAKRNKKDAYKSRPGESD